MKIDIKWRIYHQINSAFENFKNYIAKNINIILLLIAFLIIAIGISMIYDANQIQTRSNYIAIYPLSALSGYLIPLNSEDPKIIEFNSSKPISLPDYLPDFIEIEIKYKEPVMREDNLNLNAICTRVRDSFQNESIHTYNMELELYGWSSKIDSKIVHQNITNFALNKRDYEVYNITKNKNTIIYDHYGQPRTFFRPAHTFCDQLGGELLTLIEPNSNDEFDFAYGLRIFDEDTYYILTGKAILYYPIKSVNQAEELSIKTNKKILILTGWLLILGSFPFILSIRQFLRNN